MINLLSPAGNERKREGVDVERNVSSYLGKIKGGDMAANRIRSDTKVGSRCDV
jgi:hypothetical protein